MAGKKRTYSSKSNGIMDQTAAWKRLKTDGMDDELRYPSSTPRRPQQSSLLLKKSLNRYNGPVSFAEDHESETASVFENAAKRKLKPVINRARRTFGTAVESEHPKDMLETKKQSNARPTPSHLPTPPVEIQKQQENRATHLFSNRDEGSTNLATQVTSPAWKRPTTPNTSEDSFEPTKTRKSYVPKQYHSNKAVAPRRDLLGDRLSNKSKEVKLWVTNQSSSPFLRLPAEVRSRIYEEALGGNTILIDYRTYNSSAYKVVPVFKYHCTVYSARTDPFAEYHNSRIKITTSFTLFSGVCRQLYLETDVLALKLNLLAFTSHNVMANFLLLEQRFSLNQRLAIKRLALYDMPGSNTLTYLSNLEQVWLGGDISCIIKKGWYCVVRGEGVAPKLERKSY